MPNRNGAFPTHQIKSDILRFDGTLPLYLPNPPSVTAALATAYNKVRVYYSTEMKHSDPEAADDSLNPDNYEFSEEHSPIYAQSVALTQASPTIVEITLTAEMTQGESYTVTVSNVLSIGEEPLGASIAAFTGFGISPQVASAEVMQPRCTRIHFDEAMKHDAALELESNYVLTGPTSPTVDLISVGEILGITYADVFFTGSVTHGGAYHIEVSNVKDLAENVINPSYDTGDFTGLNPELTGAVASTPAGFAIQLTFNTEMKHVNPLDPLDVMNYNNYTVVGPLGSQPVINVTLSQASPTIIKIHLGTEMHDGGEYTVTVSNVQTIGGFTLYVNEAEFTGVGVAPYVVSASTLEPRKFRVTFDDMMKKDAAFLNASNYAITGPTSPTATLVEAESPVPSTCDVTFTGAVTHGGLYQVEVSNVLDIAENPIDTAHDTGNFTGMNPEVSSAEALIGDNEFFLDVNDLSGAAWLWQYATYSTTPVLLRNGTIGTKHTFREDDTDDIQHGVGQTFDIELGVSYCQYWEVKYNGDSANPREWVCLTMTDGVGLYGSWFNTRYGTLGGESISGITAGRQMAYLGDGWYGVWTWIDSQQTALGGGSCGILPTEYDNNDRILTETPGGQDSFYCANQQLVTGRTPKFESVVRVSFNMEMKHASSSNPDDALNPANYELTCPILDADATSVYLVQANPTVVDLALDAEMTQGGSYTLTVSDVLTIGGFPLYVTEADFLGMGVSPQLESADCTAFDTVVVWFDELMTHNANLEDETNYTIAGPTVLTVTDVVAADQGGKTKCTLTVSGFMHDDNYQVNVVEVIDLAGNVIDPAHDEQTFLGICPGPKVSLSKPNLHTAVFIQFDQPVLNALDHTHYTFDPDPEVVEIEEDPEVENGYIVVMNVDEEGVDYTMFISADVTGTTGFPMNPDHDTVDFTGKANEPPVALLSEPLPGSDDWALTKPIKVRAYDPQYLLGIDETTWNITITRPLLEGGTETLTPVIAGELQAGFSGSKSGDPLRPVGVTWALLPDLLWAQASTYTVESYIEDTEGMPNVDPDLGTFETVIVDAEDVDWEETDLDKALWTSLFDPDLKNCEILRSYLLPICTHSPKKTIRSRTLLYWASRCPNRVAAPLVDEFRVIADMKFRMRPTTDEFFAVANDFLPRALRAVDELASLDDATKADLKALLTDPLPINIVSTMASIVILAVFETQD